MLTGQLLPQLKRAKFLLRAKPNVSPFRFAIHAIANALDQLFMKASYAYFNDLIEILPPQ